MKDKILKILDHYGEENQIMKTIEELDELKEALQEHDVEHIVEEIADVWVMIEQIIQIFKIDIRAIKSYKNYKVERTLLRIEKGE